MPCLEDTCTHPAVTNAWTVFHAVIRKDLLESFHAHRLALGFLCASVLQVALVYLQLSSSAKSPLAMSFFFLPNVLVLSALASFVCLGSVMDEREGSLFALEMVSPASRLGLAAARIGYSAIVTCIFCVPMFVTLPASRSVYGYYEFWRIGLAMGVVLLVSLCYALGATAMSSVIGRRSASTTLLSLWFVMTAWFMRTPFEQVPRAVSVIVPADLLRLLVFKLFWETTHYSSIEGIDIATRVVFPLLVMVVSGVLVVTSYLLISRRCDVY